MGTLIFGIVLVSASYAWAMAAGETFANSRRPYGQVIQTTPGFVASNVHYSLDPIDPGMVSTVSFELDGPATDVRVELVSANTRPSTCSNRGGLHWSCPVAGPAAELDELTVIAAL